MPSDGGLKEGRHSIRLPVLGKDAENRLEAYGMLEEIVKILNRWNTLELPYDDMESEKIANKGGQKLGKFRMAESRRTVNFPGGHSVAKEVIFAHQTRLNASWVPIADKVHANLDIVARD